ncbi:hypothetical protein PGT21_015493 [Puccinia graminis f. sp. tritici]|uniref:Uncharacterized protein n=1 Tax=Puccinia graminis f. sp. tritici TaxID=56615 RepID=A0A5B0LQP9_PUCGR|nr:hypothetical protein PGT21_015493 [Puccinia graminis f. sp. tritici]
MKNLQSSNIGHGGQAQVDSTSEAQATGTGKHSQQDAGPKNAHHQDIVPLPEDTEDVQAQKTVPAQGGDMSGTVGEREHLSLEEIRGTSSAPDKEDKVIAGCLTKDKQRDAYRNLLTDEEEPGPLLVVNKAPNVHSIPPIARRKTDRERLWDQVCKAKESKDEANADFLLRIYLSLPKDTDVLAVPVQLSNVRSSSSDAALPTQHSRSVDKTVNFIRGSVPNHFDIGFTPFFDKNIREFRGPLPLTIFNKEWQEDAVSFHSGK